MASVRVESSGVQLEVNYDETLFLAAAEAGYYWPTSCHGVGNCTRCWILVEEGAVNLSPAGSRERDQIEYLERFIESEGKPIRLACQVRVRGDVVVRKVGVRKFEDLQDPVSDGLL